MSLAVGVSIRDSRVSAAVIDEDGQVLANVLRRTPNRDANNVIDVVVEIVGQLRSEHEVDAVGVGAAGFVDVERSTVLFAPNLTWRDVPLRADLSDRLELPVFVENDANAVAWAEYRFGAGERHSDLIVLTIGTGIGAGVIINDKLYRGHFGIAGEPGHMRVVPGGRLCGCGNRGCLEQYCSGLALVRAAREVAHERPGDAVRLLDLAHGDIESIDGPVVTKAAQEGDAAAVDCFDEIGRWLGQGLADLASVFDPCCFVIGGGVAEAGELLLSAGRETYDAVLTGRGYRPLAEIVPAQLGSKAGLIGAADLARQA